MRQLICLVVIFGLGAISSIHADEAVCKKGQEIQEANTTKHKNYEYYEDFLKDQEAQNPVPSQENALRRAFAPHLKNNYPQDED